MEANGEKPDRKHKREMKASKSATLPPGAMLMAHPGEGFFTKIRRCLRLRSKGKYDFSHSSRQPDTDGVSIPTSHDMSSNSPVREDVDIGKPITKSSPIKASTRRSKSDKEEVLLIRSDKKSLSGVTTKTVEGIRDDILVVTVGENRIDTKEKEIGEASAMCLETENKENNEVFEDFDPDYETLDDIRRKVRSQAENGIDTSSVQNSPTFSHHKIPTRQPLQVKIKTNADLNGQDSGLGSPFTDSPGSSRESQGQSVTSSVFSSSAASSSTSEPCKEPTESMSSVVLVEKIPQTQKTDNDPMVTSSTSCCSNSALEEDDLYSNAKVLIRKKSQKQSQSQTSLSTSDQMSSGLLLEQPRSARNSLSPADFLAMIEAENPEPLAPPPLPARNYSDEDVKAKVDKTDASGISSTSDIRDLNSASPSIGTNFDSLNNCSDVRPKTRPNAVIELGPSIAKNSVENIRNVGDDMSVPSELSLSAPQNTPTPLTPTNNIYEDIPDRPGINPLKNENKTGEDDLMYIDDDLSVDGECQTDRTNSSDLPEDVMIVSASDSCCGNDTDDSQGNQVCSVTEETEVQLPNALNPPDTESSSTVWNEPLQEAVAIADSQEESDRKYDIKGGMPDTHGFGASDLREDSSQSLNTTTSSSHLSASSSASSPLSASSSDTLNNLMDDPDPDDFEGKDLSPPVGPSIHISHQQLLRHLNARARGEDLPSESGQEQGGVNSGARNVHSMEIPRCHFTEQEDEAASGASNIRRHSSSAAAAASSHRDFLESMKQLKDCGWYWGPLSYEEAESKLIDKHDGSFLVRDSSNENYILSLSFKSMGQVHHTRIEHHKGLFSFWSQPDSHGKAQICQFIEQTVENSKNGRFLYFLRPAGPGSPPLPIQLLYPVSRFFRVPSLQHMCRFLVLRRVRRDHIDFLPLPQKVKAYLLEKQYYVETLEED